ncbi:MAG: hypothetical protein LIO59_06720 [Oscillospiraceae bacterium]|nr:hypothetical protein [Oscillospiraceae bacterium]
MKKKTKIILTTIAALAAAFAVSACSGGSTTTTEKVTPTFMYFYTNADVEVVEPLIDELQAEYGEKVNFSLVNVDENPEALENFSLVSGNTPALIMLNTDNDISKFEFSCTDKEVLSADIEEALNN